MGALESGDPPGSASLGTGLACEPVPVRDLCLESQGLVGSDRSWGAERSLRHPGLTLAVAALSIDVSKCRIYRSGTRF